MTDIDQQLQNSLERSLGNKGFELIGFEPNENSQDSQDSIMSYVVKIRAQKLDPSLLGQDQDSVENGEGDSGFDIPSLLKNADILLKYGDIKSARGVYRAILDSKECASEAYLGLGRCAEADGKITKAIELFEEAVAYEPSLENYEFLAGALVKNSNFPKAIAVLNRALSQRMIPESNKVELHRAVGNCYLKTNLPEKAEEHYLFALEVDPSSDEIQSNLGSLYLESGRIVEAKKSYQDALAANPSNTKAYLGLGCSVLTEGNKKGAHDCFAMALRADSQNSTAIYYLVKIAYQIQRYDVAEELLLQYVDISPVSVNLLYSLAGLQYHLGKKQMATETIEKILHLRPEHKRAVELKRLITQLP